MHELNEFAEPPSASNTPLFNIYAFNCLFLYGATTVTTTLYCGSVLFPNLATITTQKAREQGKESAKPKWDTDMVWISAWDTELK